MTNGDFDFRELETDVDADGNFKPKQTAGLAEEDRQKYPCEQCAGTGLYQRPRVHQEKENCFACAGRGYFFTSYADRMKRRAQAAANKVKKQEAIMADFESANPGMIEFLKKTAMWSQFAHSLHDQLTRRGTLSESQVVSIRSMMEKEAAKQAEKLAAEKEQTDKNPLLDKLAQAFLSSSATLKYPKLRLKTESGQPVVLTRCTENSKTPGHINITDGGPYGANTYFGRIAPDGRAIFKTENVEVVALLVKFNEDPQAEIKVQGIRTGQCCCCGRELTDQESIANGVGPICAEKWGF